MYIYCKIARRNSHNTPISTSCFTHQDIMRVALTVLCLGTMHTDKTVHDANIIRTDEFEIITERRFWCIYFC